MFNFIKNKKPTSETTRVWSMEEAIHIVKDIFEGEVLIDTLGHEQNTNLRMFLHYQALLGLQKKQELAMLFNVYIDGLHRIKGVENPEEYSDYLNGLFEKMHEDFQNSLSDSKHMFSGDVIYHMTGDLDLNASALFKNNIRITSYFQDTLQKYSK